jgi:hypothetical protein
MTQPYLVNLDLQLQAFPDEVYPGQKDELASMTKAAGCDICEHVPTLAEYGRKVSSITEMGVRFGWSTRSFLYARPKVLKSYDRYEWGSTHQSGAIVDKETFQKYKARYDGVVDFSYHIADTTKMDTIEPTELLFIDTFHHRDALAIELEKHGNQASKYLIMHDTQTFGECGQADDSKIFFDATTTSEPGTGLRYAIEPWLAKNPHWVVERVYTNNNGLTILRRTN